MIQVSQILVLSQPKFVQWQVENVLSGRWQKIGDRLADR
jgi:hypothetical protein